VRTTSPDGLSPHGVFFLDKNRGWIVGDNVNAGPTIIGTATRVRLDEIEAVFDPGELSRRVFHRREHGTVVGDSTILRTTDGGITWTKRTAGSSG